MSQPNVRGRQAAQAAGQQTSSGSTRLFPSKQTASAANHYPTNTERSLAPSKKRQRATDDEEEIPRPFDRVTHHSHPPGANTDTTRLLASMSQNGEMSARDQRMFEQGRDVGKYQGYKDAKIAAAMDRVKELEGEKERLLFEGNKQWVRLEYLEHLVRGFVDGTVQLEVLKNVVQRG